MYLIQNRGKDGWMIVNQNDNKVSDFDIMKELGIESLGLKVGDLIDEFTEVMMGKYGRPEFEPEFALMFQDISSISIQNFMDGITEFLVSFSDQLDTRYDTDLLNIRDEMLALINKSKFLLTLKY